MIWICKRATQNNNAGRAVVEKILPQEQGKARELTAKMLGVNPHYVTDAKKIERDIPKILNRSRVAVRWNGKLVGVPSQDPSSVKD
jgi:hypothetical protein